MFNGDELLPDPASRNPSRGIELCGVVEAMFSYTTMFSIHGDVVFADRAEQIAYNALPATWASPKGGDMWAHQYLQAVNEVNAIKADPHVWTHDGDLAETYGLDPNYGCCTANFNQGWPKFAHMTVFQSPSGGAVVGIYAPMTVTLGDDLTVSIITDYPFGDSATVIVTNQRNAPVGIKLRIPSWASAATVNGMSAWNGTFWEGECTARSVAKFIVEFNPAIRVDYWHNGAVSVHRGALMCVDVACARDGPCRCCCRLRCCRMGMAMVARLLGDDRPFPTALMH